jgi:hypothetical protein
MFNGVSTSGTSQVQMQIGSGSFSTSGYSSGASYGSGTGQFAGTITSGFILESTGSASVSALRYGSVIFTLFSGTTWVSQGNTYANSSVQVSACAGVSPSLSGALDRIRITTINGTDTFDAGSINISYE